MKVLCTVKSVINPDVKVKLTADGQLDIKNVEYKLNPFDEYSVEEAIRLKEAGKVEEIVVVSVAQKTKQTETAMRTAMAMGADRGIIVEVEDENTLDALTVARLLAGVCEKEEPGLVLMGKLTVDSEGNQVGQMLAEIAGYGQGTFAFSLDIEGDEALVGREVDGGTQEVKLALPAVVTADLRLNEPRYASLPGIMKAKRKPLDVISASDFDVELESNITITGYELPPERSAGEMVEDVDALISKLRDEAKVI